MSFTHVEDSGFYDCQTESQGDMIQFHVIVNENCEWNENCSSENSFSINQSIDVSTTTTTISSNSPELLQLELLERLKNYLSGDGLINHKSMGVC